MKKILLFCFLTITICTHAQDLPTKPANGFAFPLRSKFTIRLFAIDSIHFDYSVIAFEPFDKIIDTREKDSLFPNEGQDSTIAFYFCTGTYGNTKKEKDDHMEVLLLMKNYSKILLKYSSDIQTKEDGEFESTSNMGCFPGAIGSETWPYMIYMIGLNGFQKYDNQIRE
jgi:hypothetical protein